MKKNYRKYFVVTMLLAVVTMLFTLLVALVDKKQIGPDGTTVGFAAINGSFADAVGVSPLWDKVSDVAMVFAIAVAVSFAVLGLIQLIRRKKFFAVDKEILLMAVLYIVVAVIYVLFDKIAVINLRPVLLEGEAELESSFPSSHVLVITSFLGAAEYAWRRIFADKKALSNILSLAALLVIAVGFAARLISGVHWLTDILGGLLYSATVISAYVTAVHFFDAKDKKVNKRSK